MFILLQDTHPSPLSQNKANRASIKWAIGLRISPRCAVSLTSQHQEDKRVEQGFAAASNNNVCHAAPDGAGSHAKSVQATSHIIDWRFTIALNAVANGRLTDIRHLKPGN